MEANKKNKLIICMRHGERSDHIGLIPKLGYCDPELTENGCQQAYNMGKIIKNEINKICNEQVGKIMVISSPFARTLQTSRGVISGMTENFNKSELIEREIHIDNLLCEYISEKRLIEKKPVEYLSLYNDDSFFPSELENFTIRYLNPKEDLPITEEFHDTCLERLKRCVQNLTNEILIGTDVSVVILVSHGTPLDNLNKILGFPGPFGFCHINYCNSYFYNFDLENNTTEYLYKRSLDEN